MYTHNSNDYAQVKARQERIVRQAEQQRKQPKWKHVEVRRHSTPVRIFKAHSVT